MFVTLEKIRESEPELFLKVAENLHLLEKVQAEERIKETQERKVQDEIMKAIQEIFNLEQNTEHEIHEELQQIIDHLQNALNELDEQ